MTSLILGAGLGGENTSGMLVYVPKIVLLNLVLLLHESIGSTRNSVRRLWYPALALVEGRISEAVFSALRQ